MENMILKVFESFKVPGIIIVMLYFVLQQKFVSLVKSSDIEKLFFTHEKKLVYKAYNWIAFYFLTCILISAITFSIWFLIPRYKYIAESPIKVIASILFILMILASVLLLLMKKNNKISSLLELLNGDDSKLSTVFAIYYLITSSTLAYTIATSAQSAYKNNTGLMMVLSIGIFSLFIPGFLKSIISPWIYKERTIFSIYEGGNMWYILKIIKENEFLIGDNYEEEHCKKIKFVNYEVIKKKDIIINSIKIKPNA